MSTKYSLTIGWLYPELMSTYGDRGNIVTFKKRCEWRGINVDINTLDVGFNISKLKNCNFLFMGGAQDQQQKIVSNDFTKEKVNALKDVIENGTPGLYICGAYQFLGKYYKEADGTVIPGLNILDLYTENPGEKYPRLIGNVITKSKFGALVGFENHGGRTYLGKNINPLGETLVGFGNNGNLPAMQDGKALQAGDKTEGAIYKNSFGTYLHGPILPKNPQFADYLIKLALEKKYGNSPTFSLSPLGDFLENKARAIIAKRLGVKL